MYVCACVYIYISLSRIYFIYILKVSSCLSTIFSTFEVSLDFGLSHQDTYMHEEYKGLYLSEVYMYILFMYTVLYHTAIFNALNIWLYKNMQKTGYM